ncbi:hypothetical protein ES707_01759 [subsurface metagenome]
MAGGYAMEEKNSNPKKIISQHIFMFPFRMKTNYNLEKLKEDGWKYKPFNFESDDIELATKYNEYVYFHEYVRNALFNDASNENDSVSFHFERDIPQGAKIVLHIKEGQTYTLPIKRLSLRLFETNVGILTIELSNYEFYSPIDVFIINDFGRRIYPQFIGSQNGTDATKGAFLADKIELYLGEKLITEDFKTEDYLKKELKVASYIDYLLGNELKDKVIPVIDDRMYTMCWYGNDAFSKLLWPKNGDEYGFESSNEWYKFIYVDGKDIGVANEKMKRDLIKAATYTRWVEYGTLFGISRYSFVCVTNEDDFGYNVIRNHMRSIYHQMAVILLAQRASILKFSDDVSKITGLAKSSRGEFIDKKFKSVAESVKMLYSSFIRFINRLYFEEVSPQDQGIEMYNMAVKNMGLREQLNELRYEIERLYEFVDILQEKFISKGFRFIQVISFLFIAPMLAATLVNMGVFSENIKILIFGYNIQNGWLFIILALLISIIFLLLFKIGLRRRR